MDLRKLKALIDLVEKSGIAELEISEGEERVRITRSRSKRTRLLPDLPSRATDNLSMSLARIRALSPSSSSSVGRLTRTYSLQVKMLSAGRDNLYNPPQGTPEKVEGQSSGPGMNMLANHLAWPALLGAVKETESSITLPGDTF